MIDQPDGSRRLPTKEEILNGIKSRSASSSISDANDSESIRRPVEGINGTDRYTINPRSGASSNGSGTPFQPERGNRPVQSSDRSATNTNDRVSSGIRPFGGDSSSANQYDKRYATDSSAASIDATTVYHAPLKKSKFDFFKPYSKAIKESVATRTKKKPATTAKKTQRKVYTSVEARTKRDELIEVLLWESEQSDALLIAITKGHNHSIVIWSDISKREAGVIADYLLFHAQKSPRFASAVDEMLDLKRRVEVGVILIPRAYRSIMLLLEKGIALR